uniref:Fatty acyl-CoA reductase n=1 Tax=Culicoides sonorensis TaxID=179676 RepID=A0A336LU08_CULSO
MSVQKINSIEGFSSPVKEFYKNKTIFLTGGTGFLGQIIIEKLLRCCEIDKLYILIRSKRGKSWQERIQDICADPLFNTVKQQNPLFYEKIVCVTGDCSQPNLGLSLENQQILCDNVQIVFHAAATVRFDEKLSIALNVNVRGTQNVVSLCQNITHLMAFVHISTAFSNCNRPEIREKIYEPTRDMVRIMNAMSSELIDVTQDALIEGFPNSYVFSKHIAEYVVKKSAKNLPIVVFRPAIVMCTYDDPVTGWINNFYGPIGLMYGAATGALRVFPINKKGHAEFVPVDMCVSAILASAWDIAHTKGTRTEIPVYNFVPKKSNPITFEKFIRIQLDAADTIPLAKCYWYYTFSMIESHTLAKILHFFYHVIPAFFVDLMMSLMGKKFRLMPIYKKISKMMDALPYFYYHQWIWHDNNVSELWRKLDPNDRKWLFFDMGQLNWPKYMYNALVGMRWYVVKEDESTIPIGLQKQKRFKILHYTIVYTIQAIILYFIWLFITKIYFRNF